VRHVPFIFCQYSRVASMYVPFTIYAMIYMVVRTIIPLQKRSLMQVLVYLHDDNALNFCYFLSQDTLFNRNLVCPACFRPNMDY